LTANDSYAELDRNGEWYDDRAMAACGCRLRISGWDPYGYGQWQQSGYGWSWVSSAPWGLLRLQLRPLGVPARPQSLVLGAEPALA
jgi:hypothetical protein